MHGLVTLFLEVIALAIILLVVGLAVPYVLVVASTTIMALIVLMMIIRLAIIAITSVALIVITIFVATVLLVARFMATCCKNMSHTLFLWLLLVPGNLLKNASCLVGRLTLLKEGNHSEWVGRYRLVQVVKLVLVRLGLCKEDLFTLLLRSGYVHHSMEVVTLKLAEKLHSGCDFFRKYTDTQIHIGRCAKVFPSHTGFFLSAYLFCIIVISLRNNTDRHKNDHFSICASR